MTMAKSAEELVQERLGTKTRTNDVPVTTSVGTASVVVLRQDPTRLAAVFVNLSANNIFIKPGGAAATSSGIRLNSNGGSAIFVVEDTFTLAGSEWNAIASGASSDIYILEVISIS